MIVHYQPIVEIDTGSVMRVEALLRTEDGAHGLSTAAFIAQAESNGLIREVTSHIAGLALADAKEYRFGLPLSINISTINLTERDFVERFLKVVAEFDREDMPLTFEMQDGIQAALDGAGLEAMQRLQGAGVRFSIDGFGQDLSQFSHIELERIGIVELKIHSDLGAKLSVAANRVAVESIVALAERLGLDLVAKNVESAEHLASVRAVGARFAQGYHIAQPMSALDLAAWIVGRPRLARTRKADPELRKPATGLENALRFFRR